MGENKEIFDLDEIYENIDKMTSMKRYKPPTPGYFPSVAEINTYARSDKFEHMIPYLIWLEDALEPADKKVHKEAIAVLQKIIDERTE